LDKKPVSTFTHNLWIYQTFLLILSAIKFTVAFYQVPLLQESFASSLAMNETVEVSLALLCAVAWILPNPSMKEKVE
jgi:hypothetical protein